MRPIRPGLSYRPPTRGPRPAYYTDGSEEDDEYCSTLPERDPAPYGPVRPGTPSYSPSSEYTVLTRPPSPAPPPPLSSLGTPLSSPNQASFQGDYHNGFQPPYQPGYWTRGYQPPPSAQMHPHYRPTPHVPGAFRSASAWPPPTYQHPTNDPFNYPPRTSPRVPGQHPDTWMPYPKRDPIRPFRSNRNGSPGASLNKRSRSSTRKRSASEVRLPRQSDPEILAALKGKDHENKVLRQELHRIKKEEEKREAKAKEAELERLKGVEEEFKRFKLYEQTKQMEQDMRNKIFTELQQGSPASPISMGAQLGAPGSGFSSEATPSSGLWTLNGGLTVRQQTPRVTGGGISLNSYLYDQHGNPQLEIYAKPVNTLDTGVRGRQPGRRIRFG